MISERGATAAGLPLRCERVETGCSVRFGYDDGCGGFGSVVVIVQVQTISRLTRLYQFHGGSAAFVRSLVSIMPYVIHAQPSSLFSHNETARPTPLLMHRCMVAAAMFASRADIQVRLDRRFVLFGKVCLPWLMLTNFPKSLPVYMLFHFANLVIRQLSNDEWPAYADYRIRDQFLAREK